MGAKIKWLFLRIRDFCRSFYSGYYIFSSFPGICVFRFLQVYIKPSPGVGDGGTGSHLYMDCSVRSMLCAQAE